jgi:hypothetical protein
MAQSGDKDDLHTWQGVPSTPMSTGDHYPGDLETNPSDNDVIATTGALEAGWYLIQMFVYSSVDAIVELVERDATNSADNSTQRLAVKSAIGNADLTYLSKIRLLENERYIARMDGGVTGNVQASILAAQLLDYPA